MQSRLWEYPATESMCSPSGHQTSILSTLRSQRFALELLLTIPQRHDVIAKQSALGPNVALGSVQHLPPTLTGKYYFTTAQVKPYVGVGVNITWFTDNSLSVAGSKLDIDKTSVGAALQAGCDFSMNDHWSPSFGANADSGSGLRFCRLRGRFEIL